MPQQLDTDPSLAWSYDGDVSTSAPNFDGSAIVTSNTNYNTMVRQSLADAGSVLSMRVRVMGDSILRVGLVGSAPLPQTYLEYEVAFFNDDFVTEYYLIDWTLSAFGSYGGAPIFLRQFLADEDTLYSHWSEYRLDLFFLRDAQQQALVFTRGNQRYTTGFQNIGAAIPDWGVYYISFFARNGSSFTAGGGGRIDQIRIQYNLTDAQVQAIYDNATTPGWIGEDGLPGRPGGIPGVTLLSGSQIAPEATAKVSHIRIQRGERTPEQAQNFHESMKERA